MALIPFRVLTILADRENCPTPQANVVGKTRLSKKLRFWRIIYSPRADNAFPLFFFGGKFEVKV
ncbi:MAG: hypothetical protein ACO36E_12020, partial [Synechocystis sp.]